jgi:integrase
MKTTEQLKRETLAQCADLLGHANLQTTMIYVHCDGERVRSPLDTLPTNIVPFETVMRRAA